MIKPGEEKKEKKPTSTSQQSQQKYLIKLESGLFNGPSSPIISFKKQQYCHQIHSPFRRTDFQVPAVSFRECMPAGTPQKKPVEAWKGAATWSNIERNKVVSWRLFEKKLMSSATSHLFWSNIFFILACCWNIFYLHEYRENFMVQKVSHIYNMNLKLWKKTTSFCVTLYLWYEVGMDIKIDITALLGHLNPRGSRLNSNSDNLDVLRASQSQTEKPMFLPDDATDVAAADDNQIGFMNLHPPEICDRKNKVEELTWKTIHARNY